jgi:phosphoglycolate phosphatase
MRLLIFDLDGTLIDSKLDLAHSVNAARAYMEMPPLEHALIYTYVGNGAPMLIRRALGQEATQADVDRALDFFIRYYAQHCLDFTMLYPGVKEALDRLRSAQMPMAILTNKPVRISHQIVKGLGLGDHFFRVYGGNSFEQKKPDPVGIHTLLEECGLPRSSAVMVGDSAVDIRTARNANIQACGVTYGFQPESLKETPPDILVNDLRELADYLLPAGPTT